DRRGCCAAGSARRSHRAGRGLPGPRRVHGTPPLMSRTAEISRRTGETDITVALTLDGSGQGSRNTGVGFFDHMLDAFARHGGFETDLVEEFVRAVANNAKLTVHITVERGRDSHHMVEASFKAFARALRVATGFDPNESGIPSTKGLL